MDDKDSRIHTACPFCGGRNIGVKFGGHREKGGMYAETAQAFCEDCKAHGPRQEVRNFSGHPSIGNNTRNYLMRRAQFFFGHGYFDVEGTNGWNLAKHGDMIRNDNAPDFKED